MQQNLHRTRVKTQRRAQKICSPDRLEENNSEAEEEPDVPTTDTAVEDRVLADQTNVLFPKERFQNCKQIVNSKETEAAGGLNLAVKRTKPNTGGPKSSCGPLNRRKMY